MSRAKICCITSFLLVLLVMVGSDVAGADEYVFAEELLGVVNTNDTTESARAATAVGCSFAVVGPVGERHQVFFNGQPVGPVCDWADHLSISPDGKRLAFILREGGETKPQVVLDGKAQPGFDHIGKLRWSSDSKRLVYTARKDGKYGVIENGEGEISYDRIGEIAEPFFSPDSQRLAFTAKQGDQWFVILEGRRLNEGHLAVHWPVFSGDSRIFAYTLGLAPARSRIVVGENVMDVEAEHGTSPISLSVDGRQYAFGVLRESGTFLMLNGKEVPESAGAIFPRAVAFSPDGKRVAYPERVGAKERMVVDGAPGVLYEEVRLPSFSPDGQRVVYLTRTQEGEAKRECVVVDGVPGPAFESVHHPSIVKSSSFEDMACVQFGPVGSRFLYVGKKDGKRSVVVDGKVEFEVDETVAWVCAPVFSRNGRHVAYLGKKEDKRLIIVDGVPVVEEPKSSFIATVALGDDGRWAYAAREKGQGFIVVVQGVRSKPFSGRGAGPVFREDGVMECLMIRDKSLYRVTARAPSKAP